MQPNKQNKFNYFNLQKHENLSHLISFQFRRFSFLLFFCFVTFLPALFDQQTILGRQRSECVARRCADSFDVMHALDVSLRFVKAKEVDIVGNQMQLLTAGTLNQNGTLLVRLTTKRLCTSSFTFLFRQSKSQSKTKLNKTTFLTEHVKSNVILVDSI